jgi:hypothetical protein
MYKALLIGFKYTDNLTLPGVHVDLYNAYRFCNYTKADILVCTDIENDEKTGKLTNAVFKDVVDSGVISFISKIKERNEYRYVNDYESLENTIRNIFKNETPLRLFIYFTGHGIIKNEDNGLILPNEDVYSFYNIRDNIMGMCRESEIVWINDCCHISGMGLPYKLNIDETYELTEGHFCPIQKLIFIGSTGELDKSLISNDGSVFSGVIFKKLLNVVNDNMNNYRDVRVLSREIKERFLEIEETRQQQPTFYCSYSTIFSLYPWFFGKKFYFDNEFQSIVFVDRIKNSLELKWNPTIIKESTPANQQETSIVCWNNTIEKEIN